VWEGRKLEVGYRRCRVVGVEERRSLAGARVRHTGRAGEFHIVLGVARRMAVVGELRRAVGEGRRKVVVVVVVVEGSLAEEGIGLVGVRHKAADSLAEEDIDWEEGRRKAVEEGSRVEGEDVGRSLTVGNLRCCQRMRI
jgi:hypothetical protein